VANEHGKPMQLTLPFRRAVVEDAPVLAELVNAAGDGLPLYLWEKMAALGESAWDVGSRRATREEAASHTATPSSSRVMVSAPVA
jgi:hypothetical protein